jgi:hypothetical protein
LTVVMETPPSSEVGKMWMLCLFNVTHQVRMM